MEGSFVSEERLNILIDQVKSSGSLCITIEPTDNFSPDQIKKLKEKNIQYYANHLKFKELICYDNNPRKTREFQNLSKPSKPKPSSDDEGWGFFPM